MQRSFAKAAMLSILLCAAGFAGLAQSSSKSSSPAKSKRTARSTGAFFSSSSDNTELHFVVDTTVHPNKSYITYRDRQLYVITLDDGELSELYVDGHKIASDSFYVYQPMLNKLKEQIKRDMVQAERDREQAEKDREQADRDREQADRDRDQAEKDRHQADQSRQQADRDRQQAEKDREQADRDREQATRDRDQGQRDREQADREREGARRQADHDREQADRDREQAERDRQQSLVDLEQAKKDRAQAERDRHQADLDRKQAEKDRALIEELIKQVVKDGLAPSEEGLSIEMGWDALYVNGKKASDDVFARYKKKYISNPRAHISINKETHRTMLEQN